MNGFCVTAGAEQSEFRLLHSSCYWPTLSIIILANIDTACVVSHLYPHPHPHPPMQNTEGRQGERGRTDPSSIKKIGRAMMDKNVPSPTGLCLIVLQGWMKKLQGTEIQRRGEDVPTPAIKNQRQQLKVECKMTTFSSLQSSSPHFN